MKNDKYNYISIDLHLLEMITLQWLYHQVTPREHESMSIFVQIYNPCQTKKMTTGFPDELLRFQQLKRSLHNITHNILPLGDLLLNIALGEDR
jgi:hypothetical protein